MSTEKDLSRQLLSSAVKDYIKHSRRQVTILFTDIEDSTMFWEEVGDVQGRLMVDLHNRLSFPVIRKFRGKVIKTIGDSIMVSFKNPVNAVKAAIGIQQILATARDADDAFTLKVRIGIHTGQALVEAKDVFGDVVNVAARVESQAKGNQILVSERTAREVEEYEFNLAAAGRFKPKGKSELMSVFRVPWEEFESIIDGIKPGSYLPVVARQKVAIAVAGTVSLVAAYALYLNYLRYVAADSKAIAVLSLNPELILWEYPIVIGVIAVVLSVMMIVLLRVQAAPHIILKLLNGGFGFGVGFFVLFAAFSLSPVDFLPFGKSVVFESQHLFVNVIESDSQIYAEPAEDSEILRNVDAGNILLQMDAKKVEGVWWFKIYLGPEEYGWIIRISPPKMGVAETRVSQADKFFFRLRDIYALVLGMIGFVIGFVKFSIRPV